MAAAVRTVALKPRLNRFVHGRAVYQRNEIAVSFAVKKKQGRDGSEANAKVVFDPSDTLPVALARIERGVRDAAEGPPSAEERRIAGAHRLPFGKSIATSCFRLLDRASTCPAPAIARADPLFASVYFANLGSVGLDTPFHHLYDWGTASIYVVMGQDLPEGRVETRRKLVAPALRQLQDHRGRAHRREPLLRPRDLALPAPRRPP